MKVDVTVCTPVGVHHQHFIDRCVDTVKQQTVSPLHLIGVDRDSRGTGYVRNALLSKVKTKYVVFLDVDDLLHETFIEDCLNVIQPNSYVYTGFEFDGGGRHKEQVIPPPPKQIWQNGTWHVVTTLLWTEDVKRVGGFDPSLPALEDTDFYLKLIRVGCVCPILLEKVLFKYVNTPGSRAKTVSRNNQVNQLLSLMTERYGYKMACCGGIEKQQIVNLVDRQYGDVLVQPKWMGNIRYFGKVTNRYYGRVSYPYTFWCDPQDAEADRHLTIISDFLEDTATTPTFEEFEAEEVDIVDIDEPRPVKKEKVGRRHHE